MVMMAMYVQQFGEVVFLVHFLRMKHWNSYETTERVVLGSIHRYYALRVVFELFTIYSSEYSCVKYGSRLIRASLGEVEAEVSPLETV
jgi:hypothetical protein